MTNSQMAVHKKRKYDIFGNLKDIQEKQSRARGKLDTLHQENPMERPEFRNIKAQLARQLNPGDSGKITKKTHELYAQAKGHGFVNV